MRRTMGMIVLFGGVAWAGPEDARTLPELFAQIDAGWPNLDEDDYVRMMSHGEVLMNGRGVRDSDAGRLFEAKYRRCRDVWQTIQRGLTHVDDGVAYLTAGNHGSATREFDSAAVEFAKAQVDWHAGTAESCGESDAARGVTGRVLGARMTFPVETWAEKAKQLGGLAEEEHQKGKVPSLERIKQAPRATTSTVAGALPPKYVDNPQYGCGSLPAWQKTVSKAQPAGDPSLLPGCTKLDSDEEGGPTVQVLSRAKRLVMELDEMERTGNDGKYLAGKMAEKLEQLDRELGRGVWRSAELDPMAQSFERLAAWERNEMKAMDTRGDVANEITAFIGSFNEKTGKFAGKFYDVYSGNAQRCIDLIGKAKDDGVDLDATLIKPSSTTIKPRTYAAALVLCQNAKSGMAAKKKADAEAAAAEDAKWKTLCGGDKYKLWKAHGEFALSRGGWDRSRPEEACKADTWWGHYGPDDHQVYDCDKYTFAGSKQTGHQRKSNRWYMVCP